MRMEHGRFKRLFSPLAIGLVFVLVGGCGSSPDVPTVYRQSMAFQPDAKMVLIVSFDGLRPDAIAPAAAAHIQSVQSAGVTARKARTITPSLTLPSHTSMLTGVDVAKHGIDWNNYDPSKGEIRVTSIFEEAKKAGLKTAMVVGKEKFKHLIRNKSVDEFFFHEGTPNVIAAAAVNVIQDLRPQVMFVHFAHADTVGHKKGWMSGEQLDAIHRADQGLGRIFQGLQAMNLLESTAVIITADHGGEGTHHSHGGELSETIPWFAVGAGVPTNLPNNITAADVKTFDTAATAASLLHIPVPGTWDGHAIF